MANETRNHWRKTLQAGAGAVSPPQLLPLRLGSITVKVMPGAGGTAVVEYTLDDPKAVSLDPDAADWEEWDPGAVSATTTRALLSVVSALRVRAFSQPATAQIVVAYAF